ncbi:hypothetical protein ACFYU9_27680 [Streptomyces sp. NPDC004327]|uniref:hypothetical protein n=1 Tax=unclassified Streptomyces TaxID=2593676 RepID=UPI003698CB89
MSKHLLRAAAALALVAAVATPVAAAPAPEPVPHPAPVTASVTQATTSALKGEARLGYDVKTETVRVSVDAHAGFERGSIPTRSWGTFRISHVIDGRDYWGDFEVDCLRTGGPTATVTGRLVRTSPGHPWQTALEPHTRMGLSFFVPGNHANGPARVGLSGATLKGEPLLTRCMAPAADMPVTEGGYALSDRHA